MGSEAYHWIGDYDENLSVALSKAREEVFRVGAFNHADRYPKTIEEAVEYCDADGTGSLLDIDSVSSFPSPGCVNRLSSSELIRFFGTDRPTPDTIEKNMEFWESINRGEARAITLYENDRPVKIYYAAWTFDAMVDFHTRTGKRHLLPWPLEIVWIWLNFIPGRPLKRQ